MARLTDAILSQENLYAGKSPTLDLRYGGQNGYLPKIGTIGADGKNYASFINNHAYVRHNVIPVPIDYPRFMDFMPEKDKWIATWFAVMAEHPLNITGLNSGLTLEFDEHAIHGGGEFQEEIVDSKRARSSVSKTYKEKAGKAFIKFFDMVMRYGGMDPDAKKPLVTRYFNSINDFGGIYTPDFSSGATLYIEPDITQMSVIDAWLVVNQIPKSNGERTGSRDLRSAREAPEISIEFTGITMNNEAVLDMAGGILKDMQILKTIPDTGLILPYSEQHPTLKAVSN